MFPLEPVERFLSYLASIERSPNTVKAYAHDLKDWFAFLAVQQLDWQTVTLEDVAGFVAWLRLPPAGRDGQVRVLPMVEHHCGGASVNRKLAALTSFCEFPARLGVPLSGLLVMMGPTGRGRSSATSYKPFLAHISKHTPQRRRAITLPAPARRPQVLTTRQAQAIVDACEHLRDRLLFALLLDTGSGSVRRSGCGTRTCSSPNARWSCWRGATTTGHGRRAAGPERSRPAPN